VQQRARKTRLNPDLMTLCGEHSAGQGYELGHTRVAMIAHDWGGTGALASGAAWSPSVCRWSLWPVRSLLSGDRKKPRSA